MDTAFYERLERDIAALREQGLYKTERLLGSPQAALIRGADGREVVNLCANNYLGLAIHPAVREAAHRALDRYGYGMASVRFICGTHAVHRELEQRLAAFLGTDDAILYSSCFDANGGLFETLLGDARRGDLRRPQPRLDHRRHPPLQGAQVPLRQPRHGRARGTPPRSAATRARA